MTCSGERSFDEESCSDADADADDMQLAAIQAQIKKGVSLYHLSMAKVKQVTSEGAYTAEFAQRWLKTLDCFIQERMAAACGGSEDRSSVQNGASVRMVSFPNVERKRSSTRLRAFDSPVRGKRQKTNQF